MSDKNVSRLLPQQTLADFNVWLFNYSIRLTGGLLVAGFWLYLHFRTPKHRRWTVPFCLAFALTVAGLSWFLSSNLVIYYTNPISYSLESFVFSTYWMHGTANLNILVGELCLTWIAYRIYPRQWKGMVLAVISTFMLLRFSFQIWSTVAYYNSPKNVAIPVTLSLVFLAWNSTFVSGLFIYRFRKKLKAAHRSNRLFKTLLRFSIRHAIIPSLFAIPVLITFILTSIYATQLWNLIHLTFAVAFRVAFTCLIAHSMYLINRGEKYLKEAGKFAITERINSTHATAIQLATSFGLERRTEKIIESFLSQVQEIFDGDKGYFVEVDRRGQISVPFAFSVQKTGDHASVRIFSPTSGNEVAEIPTSALQYAVSQNRTILKDYATASFDDDEHSELDVYLADRIDELTSLLILPLTVPDSPKTKLIYFEKYNFSVHHICPCDIRVLDILGKQLAASLDSARLFAELEETNKALDEKVVERTSELQLKNLLLERAKNDALEAASAKAVFLSNMSHEIRTPISQVILAAEMLAETGLNAEGKDNVDIIVNSGKLLLNLVNDILDFSKLESGKIAIEQVEMNLYETVKISVEAFSSDEGVRIAYYMPAHLPRVVIGDATRIRQIITNLVSNALKFTKKGFVLVELNCRLIDVDIMNQIYDIDFKIIDTGTGIAPDKLNRIFERFEQEDISITRLHGGTGLGLSICQNLCHLMGSQISVTSTLGKGSTFQFTIRFQCPKIPTIPESKSIKTLPGRPRILLIEDTNTPYDYESKSVLHYQIETMGGTPIPRPLQLDHCLEVSSVECVIIDLTSLKENSSIVDLSHNKVLTNNANLPIIILHSRNHSPMLQTLPPASKNIKTLCSPFKQSTLYNLLADMMNSNATDDTSTVENLGISESIQVEPAASGKPHMQDEINKNISILLVEDNLVNQQIMKKMIAKLGYEVEIADNGLIGLEKSKQKNYDLILMDMRFPNFLFTS
ncbi:hypothetical protein BKA69DRAFT_1123937 [Paraphysoderma sedebokerense]|nr:hypothetical protein BKA69DRAFT_1123937 [Paraphysoderma sedebokerense]